MRSAGLKRAGNGILITAVAAGLLCVAGCDNGQNEADKQTRSDMAEAQQQNSQGNSAAANAKFASAAGNAAASAGLRTSAKASLAQSEFDAGQDLIVKNREKNIDQMEMDLSRAAFEIGQLANQIRISGNEVTSSRQYDPKPAKDAINAAIADAQGGPDKPAWFTQGSTILPTLSAAKDMTAKLQADLSQKQDQAKGLTQQRGVLLDQAEQATIQVDQMKGDRALEVYKRASDLRRQAGQISVQLDTLQNEISTVQNNLTVSQAQQAAVSDAISQLKDQIATLDKTWQEVDGKAGDHQKLAAEILGSSGAMAGTTSTAGGSIAQKAARWDQLVKEIRKARSEAEAHLGNAARYYDEARKAADELRKDLADQIGDPKNVGRTEVDAWVNAKLAMDPAQFRLQFAMAQRALGELHLSEAASAATRASVISTLQSALEGTSMRVPAELLSGDLNSERNNALKSADTALRESDEALENIINGRSDIKGIDITAKISRALTLYDWAQVARQLGDEKEAKARLAGATEARNSAAESNAAVPTMAPEISPPPKAEPSATPSPSAGGNTAENPAAAAMAAEAAGPPASASDNAEQAAVRAVLKTFSDALIKGDLAAAKASFQVEPGQEEALNQIMQFPIAMQKVDTAMKAKFGDELKKSGNEGFRMNSAEMADVSRVKIEVTGETATLDGGNDPMSKVIKVNGQWKLHFVGPKTDDERKQMEAMSKMGVAMTALAADIEAGKYAKPEDAFKVMFGTMMEAAGAGMPTTEPADSTTPMRRPSPAPGLRTAPAGPSADPL